MPPAEVFLSHASDDHAFTERLATVLRSHGLPVWYSETDIRGAQQWHDEIGAALDRCDWFCIVLSPHAVDSMWVKRETLYALQQPAYENAIVPLLLAPCDYEQISWVLSSFQHVDFQNDFDTGCRDLLRTWGIGYRSS